MKMENVWHDTRMITRVGTEGTGGIVARNGEQTLAALRFL